MYSERKAMKPLKARKRARVMIQRPSSMEQLAERFAHLKQMRESQPAVYDDATDSWHLVRYQEVLQVLTDATHFIPLGMEEADSHTVSSLYPLPYPLVQRLLSSALTPGGVSELASRMTKIARTLLEQVRPTGIMDVIGDLAAPLSFSVIAELLDIPVNLLTLFKEWADALLAEQWTGPTDRRPGEPSRKERRASLISAGQEFSTLFAELLVKRRSLPQADFISRLLTTSLEETVIGETEVMACCRWLLTIGYETATHLLGNAVLCLDAHPEVRERLHQEPAPIYSTIEEVLRYLPPLWLVPRMTTSEVVLGEQRIPAQARVCAWIASANRDAKHFSHPDTFDIERIPNRHLSFGYGSGFRFDAALARLQTEVGLSLLLNQLPNLKVLPGQHLEVVDHPVVFGVKHLLVTFTPSST
jgi:cytochrome P450 family 109